MFKCINKIIYKMTSVQIVSDLHIECIDDNHVNPLKYITPTAKILILAGDIGSLYKPIQLQNFIKLLSPHFNIILYIPGNHEYYMINNYDKLTFTNLENRLEKIGNSIQNLHILNRDSIRIGNLCIAGCTLWTKPECQVPNYIVRVYQMDTNIYYRQHNKDLKYVSQIMNYCNINSYKLLMVTHHPPSLKVLDLSKKRKFPSLYSNNLDHLLIKEKVQTWVCGHTHGNFDFISDLGCRIVSNQLGKHKDNITNYKKDFTINY
jgi:predicted phosphohydrolase